jgi:hypothetical protein
MPEIGDRIIVAKATGLFDVIKINESGERETVRWDIDSLHQARENARGSLTGSTIWVCDEATPDLLEPF